MGKVKSNNDRWHQVDNVHEISSPSLLVYPERVEHNIKKMISMTGSVEQLRPHVKTHKMPEIIKLQMKHGIFKFKSATISETEMVAQCGARDILLAIQPVGPNIGRFFQLKQAYRGSKISCVTDSEEIIIQLSDLACKTDIETDVWLDINVGMNRTGVSPGEKAVRLLK